MRDILWLVPTLAIALACIVLCLLHTQIRLQRDQLDELREIKHHLRQCDGEQPPALPFDAIDGP